MNAITIHEWADHLAKNLLFESGILVHHGASRLVWLWADNASPEIQALPNFYREHSEVTTLTVAQAVEFAPNARFLDLHCELLPPAPTVSFSLVMPLVEDNQPFVEQIAATGAYVLIPEPAPDWDQWRDERGITTDAAFVHALAATYQHKGFVVQLAQDSQAWLQDYLHD